MRTRHLRDPVLNRPIELQTSRLGVSTIVASHRLDVAYAMGWLHARDRAFQMDLSRRSTAGRLAELLGRSALPHDRLQRQLGLARTAEAALERLPAGQRDLLRRYAAGVNAGLRFKRTASLWHVLLGRRRMAPWREADTLLVALSVYQALGFDPHGRLTERCVRAALPPAVASFLLPQAQPVGDAVPPVPAAVLDWMRQPAARAPDADADVVLAARSVARQSLGSNCWTISGELTASGRPLLACDTHMPPGLPG